MNPISRIRTGSLCLLMAIAGLTALPAAATTSGKKTSTTADAEKPIKKTKAKAPNKADKPKTVKVTSQKGSGETTAERDRRLMRECKGRPNAGACLGYANQ